MSPWLQQLAADANFQMLVARGVKGGSLTFDEVNAVVPELAEPDRLAELVEWLDGHGISLIDDPEPDVAVAESSVPVFGFEAWPDPLDDDTPPVYQRDAAFEERLRALGVAFADAAVSFAADGRVFDAELIVSGEHALAVWLALHNAVSRTGLWPVLGDDVRHSRYWNEVLGPEQLDPLRRQSEWFERLFVPRPPRTRHQAERLCQEMDHFGEETFYSYGPYAHPDPIEAVRASHYWYFWWD